MGAGASSGGIEEILSETLMLGRAIVAVSFPGMHRIYDFHSSKAPKIKNSSPFSLMGLIESDEEPDSDEEGILVVNEEYKSMFNVKVGLDSIYFEDVNEVNGSGWTALHSCCMSYQTVEAGCALIDEMIRLNGNIDVKTITGPGAFNSGWTPLHMACAYGVEPLVEKLIEAGADVDTTNSYTCTPLLEACHRGFINVVRILVKGGADVAFNPSSHGVANSPFICSPSQTALGEAARCGFQTIVQILLEAGAPIDLQNHIGWGPLHEACFYNRSESVKHLLLNGADATKRTNCGALPFHLCALRDIKNMLSEMGNPGSVPEEGDVVDMLDIMRELTISSVGGKASKQMMISFDPQTGQPMIIEPVDTDEEADEEGNELKPEMKRITAAAHEDASGTEQEAAIASGKDQNTNQNLVTPKKEKKTSEHEEKLLHSGGILGDLPALSGGSGSNNKIYGSPSKSNQFNASMNAAIEGNSPNSLLHLMENNGIIGSSPYANQNPNPNANLEKKKKKKKKRDMDSTIPADMPKEFLCALSNRPMNDPVRSMYGNIYEKTVILDWLKNQGHICPLTGAPLVENDLTELPDLKANITKWILFKSMDSNKPSTNLDVDTNANSKDGISPGKVIGSDENKEDQDLYEF